MKRTHLKLISLILTVFIVAASQSTTFLAANNSVNKLNLTDIGASIIGIQKTPQSLGSFDVLRTNIPLLSAFTALFVNDIPLDACNLEKCINKDLQICTHLHQNETLWNLFLNTSTTYIQIDLKDKYKIDDIQLKFNGGYFTSTSNYSVELSNASQFMGSKFIGSYLASNFKSNRGQEGRYILISLYGPKLFGTDLLLDEIQVLGEKSN